MSRNENSVIPNRFVEIKGRMTQEVTTDEFFLSDLSASLQKEYPYCHVSVKLVDGGKSWLATFIHKKEAPLKKEVIGSMRGHVQGWFHAATGSNGR